jgi:hypothetical protein
MMPAQIVPAAVAMGPDTRAQPDHLGNQLLASQTCKIVVHRHPNVQVHQRFDAWKGRRPVTAAIEKISIAPPRWSSQSGALVKHKGVDEDGIGFGNAKLEASALDQLLDQPKLGMRGQHHIELSIRL